MRNRLRTSRLFSRGQAAAGAGIDYGANVRVISLLTLTAMLGFAIGFIRLFLIYREPKIWIVIGGMFVAAGLNAYAYRLAGQGQARRAAFVMLLSMGLVIPIVPLVFSGMSNQVVLVAVVVLLAIGLQILPPRDVIFVALLNLLETGLYVLLNQYPPMARIAAPEVSGLIWPIIILAAIFILGLLLWRFPALNLAGKMMVAYTVITLAVVGVIGYLSLAQNTQALTDSVGNQLHRQAVQKSQAVGESVHAQINSLQALSVGELLQRAVTSANLSYGAEPQDAILTQIQSRDQEWQQAFRDRRLSDPLISARLQNDVAFDLVEYGQVFPYNGELLLTDRYGALVAANEVTSDYYQGDEGWWQAAYNNGQGAVYVGKPAYDESLGADAFVMAVPVRSREANTVIGVLRTTLLLTAITDLLNPEAGASEVVFDFYFPGDQTQYVEEDQYLPADPAMVAQLQQASGSPYVQMDYHGGLAIVAQAPINTASQDVEVARLNWYSVAHQDVTRALAPVTTQREASLALTSIVASLASLLAFAIAQAFAGPITRLAEVAEQVGAGNLNAQAPARGQDELGRLGRSFNAMTASLRETLGGLEQRIADRTRELTLAGNVGRALSQERDVDRLLKLAVELIRSTFDLYYTQIYLTDPSEKLLVLRAGSGNVGTELLRRGHRLPIGPGSLNGAAAVNKEAAIVSDTLQSKDFKPNALLPDTRSEMVVPLLAGERVVGVLDMQSHRPGALTPENLPAFQSLAGQLAIAVENAQLFSQAQQARQEVESQARRLTRSAWNEYLDSVQRPERLGYIYDQAAVVPLAPEAADLGAVEPGREVKGSQALQAPILVAGERIGQIALERSNQPEWTPEEVALVNAVASQVARRVDGLRLLEQAERYRREAELAAQRLVREGWEEFARSQTGTAQPGEIGFVYDQNRVTPLAQASPAAPAPVVHSYPLQVREAKIGELVIEGDQVLDAEAQQIVQAVTERLSAHLENLRLSAQTQAALLTTESLYRGSDQVVRSASAVDVLQAVIENTPLRRFERSNLLMFNRPWGEQVPEKGVFVAAYDRSNQPGVAVGTELNLQEFPLTAHLRPGQPTFIADVDTDERVDPDTRLALRPLGTALVIFPLETGGQWIGWLSAAGSSMASLDEEELRQAQTLISQAATVLQSMLLLEQTQNRAQRERTLRQVAERVRSAVDTEMVLQTAVREVGAALGRTVLIRLELPEAGPGDLPVPHGNGNGR